jgi:hypothetical protein
MKREEYLGDLFSRAILFVCSDTKEGSVGCGVVTIYVAGFYKLHMDDL